MLDYRLSATIWFPIPYKERLVGIDVAKTGIVDVF